MTTTAAITLLRDGGIPAHVAQEIVRHLHAPAVQALARIKDDGQVSGTEVVTRLGNMDVAGVAETLFVDEETAQQVRDRIAFRSTW